MACAYSEIDVYVKLPSGRTLTFMLAPAARVAEIYERVARECSVAPGAVNIKYTGKLLSRTATVSGLGICRETILKAELISVKHLTVLVTHKEGEETAISISNIDDVTALRHRIQQFTEVPVHKQILKLPGGEILKSDSRMLDLGIEDGASLTLQIKPDSTADSGDQSDREELDAETQQQILSSFDAAGRSVEVVFSFDTTGSMYSCLQQVRTKLRETVGRLVQDIPGIRIGIMAHGDYCDYDSQYVLKQYDLCSDAAQLTEFVNNVPSTGGGDCPECYEWVLRKAQQLDWSENSAKALVIIGDDVPHEVSYTDQRVNWHEELDVLCGMGVKVYGVYKDGINSIHKLFYEELAEQSGGACLKLANFSLITDMFLAVCYKESSAEQLETFCEEVREQGRMSSDTEKMFEDLKEMPAPSSDKSTRNATETNRYLDAAWWDPKLSICSPRYSYCVQEDRWGPVRSPSVDAACANESDTEKATVKKSDSRRSRRKTKKGCLVM